MKNKSTKNKRAAKQTSLSSEYYEALCKDAKRCRRTPKMQLEMILDQYFSFEVVGSVSLRQPKNTEPADDILNAEYLTD